MSDRSPILLVRRSLDGQSTAFSVLLSGVMPHEPMLDLVRHVRISEHDAHRPLDELKKMFEAGIWP